MCQNGCRLLKAYVGEKDSFLFLRREEKETKRSIFPAGKTYRFDFTFVDYRNIGSPVGELSAQRAD